MSGARLRIVHAAAPAQVGGLETVMLTLAVGQRRAGYQVSLLATTDQGPEHPMVRRALEQGLEVDCISVSSRSYRLEAKRQCEVLRARAPQVVHTHGYRADLVAGFAARTLGLPRVSTAHGFTGGTLRNRFYEWLQVRTLRGFQGVVAVSELIAGRLAGAGVAAGRISVIPNAWAPLDEPWNRAEARERLGLRTDRWVVGWVGRINRVKGLDVLIQALPSLADLPLEVVILGEGPDRSELERRAAGLPVRWLGVVPEAGRYFRAFDLLVMSSRSEGTPMVGLDAMGCGVPVVATAVGGVSDLFGGDAAWLVPSERPDLLAAAIREAHHQPAVAHHRAAEALLRVRSRYGATQWVERYGAVYRRGLGQESGGAEPGDVTNRRDL